MEINVGDYVRYKEFSYDNEVKIGKKIDIFGNVDTSRGRILEHNIIKHSKDIIGLVEVGDYVNGMKVIFTKNNFPKGYYKNNKNDVVFTDYNDEYDEWFGFESDEIETVLTHEQFEYNAYKIEKER